MSKKLIHHIINHLSTYRINNKGRINTPPYINGSQDRCIGLRAEHALDQRPYYPPIHSHENPINLTPKINKPIPVHADIYIHTNGGFHGKDNDIDLHRTARAYTAKHGSPAHIQAISERISEKIESLTKDLLEMEYINQCHKINNQANYWRDEYPYFIKHRTANTYEDYYNKNTKVIGKTIFKQLTPTPASPHPYYLECVPNCNLNTLDPTENNWILTITHNNKRDEHLGSNFSHIDAITIMWDHMFHHIDMKTLLYTPNPQQLSKHAYIEALRTIEKRRAQYPQILAFLNTHATTD